jgi:hypothetical protein
MKKEKFAIVMTTIFSGQSIEDFCRQAEAEGVSDSLVIIVIPDRKSPQALYEKCASLVSAGFNVISPTLIEQQNYISRFKGLKDIIPYDSDNRRNIGFLMALEKGCEVLISLDDDNYCIGGKSVFEDYAIVAKDRVSLTCVHSSNGWFNACDLLEIDPEVELFHRGFPYNKRTEEKSISSTEEDVAIRLNEGLWLSAPDLDAISWLTVPAAKAKRLKGESVVLGQETWAPINTQNTSLAREVIVAYYNIPMEYSIMGLTLGQYGDIFSGYFCQSCIKYLKHSVRIGTPVASHRRNAHNYMQDLAKQLVCIWLVEDITEWLHELKLQGSTYAQAYLSLAGALDDQAEHFKGSIWTDESRRYLHYVTKCMRLWTKACQQIGI